MTSEFLAELHWEDGFAIPVANEENKILEDQVKKAGKVGSVGGVFCLAGIPQPFLSLISSPDSISTLSKAARHLLLPPVLIGTCPVIDIQDSTAGIFTPFSSFENSTAGEEGLVPPPTFSFLRNTVSKGTSEVCLAKVICGCSRTKHVLADVSF